jgi:hypothetical protein
MTYSLLKYTHILGAILIGAGLIGVRLADLRSRQVRRLGQFAEAVRSIAVFYDGVVVPGALLLLASEARAAAPASLNCVASALRGLILRAGFPAMAWGSELMSELQSSGALSTDALSSLLRRAQGAATRER